MVTQSILLIMDILDKQTFERKRSAEGRRQLDKDCFIRLINDFALSQWESVLTCIIALALQIQLMWEDQQHVHELCSLQIRASPTVRSTQHIAGVCHHVCPSPNLIRQRVCCVLGGGRVICPSFRALVSSSGDIDCQMWLEKMAIKFINASPSSQ